MSSIQLLQGISAIVSSVTSNANTRLNFTETNVAENAVNKIIEQSAMEGNHLKDLIQGLMNHIDNEINSLTSGTGSKASREEMIEIFSNHSSQLLQNMDNSSLSSNFKQGLESWLQAGNTLMNASLEAQMSGDFIPQISTFISQGMKFSEKINSKIFDKNNSSDDSEDTTINGIQSTGATTSQFNLTATPPPQNEGGSHNFSIHSRSESQEHVASQMNYSGTNSSSDSSDYTPTGADINMFSILLSVLVCTNQMNLNAVQVQSSINSNYSSFLSNMNDLQTVVTQMSAAFKTAATNGTLINTENTSLNLGFDGTATTASDTDSAKYTGIAQPMGGKDALASGPDKTWNLAQLLTMYKITFDVNDSPIVFTANAANGFTNAEWADNVITTNTGTNFKPEKDIYIGIPTTSPSAFLKRFAKTSTELNNSGPITMATNNLGARVASQGLVKTTDNGVKTPPLSTTDAGRIFQSTYSTKKDNNGVFQSYNTDEKGNYIPSVYFINQTKMQEMIDTLGAQGKAMSGNDFAKSSSTWHQGATQVDGFQSLVNTASSTAQALSNSVVQQIGLLNQDNTTLTNSILGAFQSISNALIKLG